jgi:hypothetical protein
MREGFSRPVWTQVAFARDENGWAVTDEHPYFTDHPEPVRRAAAELEDRVNAALAYELRRSAPDVFDPDLLDARTRKWVEDGRADAWRKLLAVLLVDEAHQAPIVNETLLELWNEKPGRTQAEVLALVDAAISRQRAHVSAKAARR